MPLLGGSFPAWVARINRLSIAIIHSTEQPAILMVNGEWLIEGWALIEGKAKRLGRLQRMLMNRIEDHHHLQRDRRQEQVRLNLL